MTKISKQILKACMKVTILQCTVIQPGYCIWAR